MIVAVSLQLRTPMALAVLKVPSGALIAVIGMLMLAGGFVPGPSNLDSQRQILAYALVFGYAQQLITRLADAQAQAIMNRLPSKDPEADQPVVPPSVLPEAPAPEKAEKPDLPADQTVDGHGAANTPVPTP